MKTLLENHPIAMTVLAGMFLVGAVLEPEIIIPLAVIVGGGLELAG